MRRPLIAIEIIGFVALFVGIVLIPYGIWQFSSILGAIVAGIELSLFGLILIALTNPELSQRRRG